MAQADSPAEPPPKLAEFSAPTQRPPEPIDAEVVDNDEARANALEMIGQIVACTSLADLDRVKWEMSPAAKQLPTQLRDQVRDELRRHERNLRTRSEAF
jgi:hypothetical protein